jgi:hypothetical protein
MTVKKRMHFSSRVHSKWIQGLEMLGQSAERLSQISMGIHEELGHQNK